MKSRSKFRNLPVGAKFQISLGAATYEKIKETAQGHNCKNLTTNQTDWLPGDENVIRLIGEAWIQTSFI